MREDIKEVIIPEACWQIGPLTFAQSGIESIIFPKELSVVSRGICYKCQNLRTVVFCSDRIDCIDTFAFHGCSELEYIRLPNEVQQIRGKAFGGTKSLRRILLPQKMGEISGQAFDHDSPAIFGFQDDRTIFSGPFFFSRNSIFCCNMGSSAYRQAAEYGIQCKPLSEFPID